MKQLFYKIRRKLLFLGFPFTNAILFEENIRLRKKVSELKKEVRAINRGAATNAVCAQLSAARNSDLYDRINELHVRLAEAQKRHGNTESFREMKERLAQKTD